MDTAVIPVISSAIVLFSLCVGAWYDIKTRTSPKWIWAVCSPVALFFTGVWYVITYVYDVQLFFIMFVTSAFLCPFCMIMGYRMGNGGDWRALFWVSLLTPWLAPTTLIFSVIFGILQIVIDTVRKTKLKSAWMISISLAFVVSIVIYTFKVKAGL